MVCSGVSGMNLSVAPRSWATCCQGTRLLWCSISEIRISSPGPRLLRAQVCATRLIPSVVFLTSTTPVVDGLPMKSAHFWRASSYRSVASMLRVWTPRWMLELYPS